jgi:hypothetical protein
MNQIIQNPNKYISSAVASGLAAINEEKILELKARIQKLGDICQDLNPYQAISPELKLRLNEFNILELSDPFKITNTLLMLLEDSIDELHILSPFEADHDNEIL